jgi:DNA-binding LacI/PurR family transcriptional regulator
MDNERIVTQSDIAKYCGVSQLAVSQTLLNKGRISDATRQRILAAADELGYDLSMQKSARRLRQNRHGHKFINNQVAVIFPTAFQQSIYYGRLLQGITNVLEQEPFSLVIEQYTGDSNFNFSPCFGSGDIDGLIVYEPMLFTHSIIEKLRQIPGFSKNPVISLMSPLTGCSSVLFDDKNAAFQATSHILKQGHRHILAFLDNSSANIYQQRLSGIYQAYIEHHINPDKYLTIEYYHLGSLTVPNNLIIPEIHSPDEILHYSPDGGFNQFTSHLQSHPEITAVIAQNDPVARRIYYMLSQAGWHLPEQLSLVSFDDTNPILDSFGQNILTSVNMPLIDMGREAIQMLIRQINEQTSEPQQVTFSGELVIRKSTQTVK